MAPSSLQRKIAVIDICVPESGQTCKACAVFGLPCSFTFTDRLEANQPARTWFKASGIHIVDEKNFTTPVTAEDIADPMRRTFPI